MLGFFYFPKPTWIISPKPTFRWGISHVSIVLWGLPLIFACSHSDEELSDRLNTLSYNAHYRDIDSTEHYARQVLNRPSISNDARAEAFNNLAFVNIARMRYDLAERQLDSIPNITNNQIELLVSYVQQMRLCQRRSHNRAFYEYREQATNALKRINEERDQLTKRQLSRLHYAESEMAIVTSTYYYYVGLERQSSESLGQLDLDEVRHDTAQYLNYLYSVGSGGILNEGTPHEIWQEEVRYLRACLAIAERGRYIYFIAQAKETLAEHSDSVGLAEEALALFRRYGDVYQIAGAYRTLATCYHDRGDDERALEYLHLALADSSINQAPDLVASICEQLSVVYSALNDKPNSDYNRNIYIDLQEQTRQDRELEARAGLLDKAVTQLNWMMLAVVVAILLLVLLLWLFNRWNRQDKEDDQLSDLLEEKREKVAAARIRVEQGERRHLEQRAKVSLAMSILPLIDRIRHEVKRIEGTSVYEDRDNIANHGNLEYIRELTDTINQQNDLLTEWIQLRQGEVSMRIESFPLQGLFDIIGRSRTGFQMKNIALEVRPTSAIVKADRVLTLFMLNTLADNARKFTANGGHVSIFAEESEHYVEVSVQDTGGGRTTDQPSHGFGLKNCRGIIEKYRKMSQLFNVSILSSEKEQDGGSRYFFRLPKGVARLLVLAFFLLGFDQLSAANLQQQERPLDRAHIYADSAYFCNINGNYTRTLLFADSCLQCLNDHYLSIHPKGRLLMVSLADTKNIPAEIQWFQQGLETNYQIVLDIRNESAVAALALHEWQLYAYNNKVYTQLFKEMSADASLADYCRTMQQSQQNKRIAVILLLVLLTSLLPAYYMLYYRHRLYRRFTRERQQQDDIEQADDELHRAELESATLHVANSVLDNCLSTLKHETMYYPSRIRQLVDSGQLDLLDEVTGYYRDLYAILIEQSLQQAERIRLHIRPLTLYGQGVLGDENLLHYLFELLKAKDVRAESKDDHYVVYTLATGVVSPITALLCRQIVRDHGEATNRRACGITIDSSQTVVTLPRYTGKQ
ncbi:MAG: DUF5112 domain-containing protein [Prevotella sp.]|nr:DUF5112 domain-containing protein [Prevotella sp.]